MNHARSRILVLLSVIIISGGKRWYPATFIEDRSLLNPEPSLLYRTNYVPDAEDRYMPLSTLGQRKDNEWQGFRRTNEGTVNAYLFNSFSANHKEREPSDTENIPPFNATKSSSATRNSNINVTDTDTVLTHKPEYNSSFHKNTQIRRKIVRRKCPVLTPRQKKQLSAKETKKRFLEIFEVVEFDHVPCSSTSGLEGTCLHESDCRGIGGATMGTCADGYGACCVIQYSCDDTSAAAAGWFTNPGFPEPSSERLSCAVSINKQSEDVKQIRLDFLYFELLPPTAGTCEQDRFVVSGQNVNSLIPILCGVNTGLHVYVEVGDVDGPISLSIQTVSADNRLFAIKVTQLRAADDLAAPTGCLQYFKGSHGYLQSFNYRDISDTSIAKSPSYLNNLNYAMCIERAPASCSITYTNAGLMQILNYDSDGLPVIPPDQAGVEIFNCPSDWLLIAAARLCGERLNDGSVLQDFAIDAPVTDNAAGPIVVWFRSDEGYVGRGFKLQYRQNLCIS